MPNQKEIRFIEKRIKFCGCKYKGEYVTGKAGMKPQIKTNINMSKKIELKDETANGTKPMLYADWRSVKDELPIIKANPYGGCSEEVLVWIETEERQKYTGIQRQIAYYTNDGWCYQYGELMYNDDMEGLTHWMPLPSSPNCG